MKIIEKNNEKMVIREAQSTNIFISIILYFIGGLASLAILFSSEPFFPTAIMPILFVITGSIIFWKKTNPYLLIINKLSSKIIYKVPQSWGDKYDVKEYNFKDITSIETEIRSSPSSSGSSYGIAINLYNGEKIIVFYYFRSGKRKINNIVKELNDYLK